MSLFEHPQYQWRETYFVVTRRSDRPGHMEAQRLLDTLGQQYEIHDVRLDEQGRIESFTLLSPADCAAMDICYVAGDDVVEQIQEFAHDISGQPLTPAERQRVADLGNCDARFEVYHFERRGSSDEEEFLDPTTLFHVMEVLSRCCRGIGIDPQAGTLVG